MYVILSLFFIIRAWKSNFFKKKKSSTKDPFFHFSWKNIFLLLKCFFESYIYYIACILFYTSLFFIGKVFFGEIDIPKILLWINILILTLYFFEHKFELFQDFIRVNTSLVSIYYVIFQIYYLLWLWVIFSFIDIGNIIILFILFVLLLRVSKKRWKEYTPLIYSYILIFIFLEYSVIIQYIFGIVEYGVSILSFIWTVLFLYFTQRVKEYIPVSLELIRIWGLISGYIFLYFSYFLILPPNILQIFYIPAMMVVIYILFLFHKEFQNYISLLIASLWILWVSYSLYRIFFTWDLIYTFLCIFFFTVSLFFFGIEKIYKPAYVYDVYFFRIFSLIVNISWVISFFLFWDFSILDTAILLLGESIYLFLSN